MIYSVYNASRKAWSTYWGAMFGKMSSTCEALDLREQVGKQLDTPTCILHGGGVVRVLRKPVRKAFGSGFRIAF